MKKYLWALNVFLIVVAVFLLFMTTSSLRENIARAQCSGEVGNLIVIGGVQRPERYDDHPLYLIDTKEQVLVVYEWESQVDRFGLKAVRKFDQDTELGYYNRSRKPEEPTPATVEKMVRREQAK